MLNFPKKTLGFIKKHLLKKEQEIDKNLKKVVEDDPVRSPSLIESSEPGTDSYIADSHNKTLVFEKQLKDAKTGIRSALLKIKKGIYGKCEKCRKHIEVGRLMIMPTAQYCISCSQQSLRAKRS